MNEQHCICITCLYREIYVFFSTCRYVYVDIVSFQVKNLTREKDLRIASLTVELICPFNLTNGKHSDTLVHNTALFCLQINCICPNNDNPGSFREKMTVVKRWNEMTPEEREIAQENPRSRFFKCRDRNGRGRGIF